VETLQQLSFDAPTLSAKLHKAGRSLEQTSFHPMLEQLNGRRWNYIFGQRIPEISIPKSSI